MLSLFHPRLCDSGTGLTQNVCPSSDSLNNWGEVNYWWMLHQIQVTLVFTPRCDRSTGLFSIKHEIQWHCWQIPRHGKSGSLSGFTCAGNAIVAEQGHATRTHARKHANAHTQTVREWQTDREKQLPTTDLALYTFLVVVMSAQCHSIASQLANTSPTSLMTPMRVDVFPPTVLTSGSPAYHLVRLYFHGNDGLATWSWSFIPFQLLT